MNKFTADAAARGRQFGLDNPSATGVQIDDASPKLNPARRAFQEAAYAALRVTRDRDDPEIGRELAQQAREYRLGCRGNRGGE